MSIIEYLPIAFVIAAFALRFYVSSQDAFAKALSSVADKSVAEQFSRRLPSSKPEITTKPQVTRSVANGRKNTSHLMAVPQ
ncbi:hypothetical protein QN372_10085 [Undibacterium sp. RTI2.1]|uniref:hypothetical protein n=1 Tax=unclassified Undibacterium TaxID=2630295 RepID=UPI002AB4260D|nr:MULTISPECIES: hypothetical protein [unclassified Undibacterium]MDY7540233.1 hypothetical protein [Undibacterium sp. 5I1]MEB0031096.1 hypothetical protein [Undibacterium sp. RTI2.1]MEB0115312.1 hypothetical protein [Undibacterium sp. RTI2.2]MEB0231411.1 hypothetical protein [Undibacterium sp. 10I3]MEB0257160.1 hypothetical protein [Undibacterium sp. 5I1]